MRGALLQLICFLAFLEASALGCNGTVVAQESQAIQIESQGSSTIISLENLVPQKAEQGLHAFADSSRFSLTKEISIEDVAETGQSPEHFDVDLSILPDETLLHPDSLRTMQSSLEASRGIVWPEITKSQKQTLHSGNHRKKSSSRNGNQFGEAQGQQGSSDRRDLHYQASVGGEFPSRSCPPGRCQESGSRGSSCGLAYSTGEQDSICSAGGGGCCQASPAPQGAEGCAWIPAGRIGAQADSMRGEGAGESTLSWAPEPTRQVEQADEDHHGQAADYGRSSPKR